LGSAQNLHNKRVAGKFLCLKGLRERFRGGGAVERGKEWVRQDIRASKLGLLALSHLLLAESDECKLPVARQRSTTVSLRAENAYGIRVAWVRWLVNLRKYPKGENFRNN